MADKNLKTLHPFLQENTTPVPSGGTIKSFTHDTGSGPILCLIHGWPQSSYEWRHLIAPLSQHSSLYIPELPGYGFSSPPPSSDKRTVGNLLLQALSSLFPTHPTRPILWLGHDRGARLGHRLLVDQTHPPSPSSSPVPRPPTVKISAAILIDIVPTLIQWRAFASPAASMGYYHWPFLAIPEAPGLISSMGGAEFCRTNMRRATGSNAAGTASLQADEAEDHYAAQFAGKECIRGSCADYAAGASEDVAEQEKDQEAGRKVGKELPLLVIWAAGNLGRVHDVPKVWREWVEGGGEEVRFEGIGEGYGHYLPEECPEKVAGLVWEWVERYGKSMGRGC